MDEVIIWPPRGSAAFEKNSSLRRELNKSIKHDVAFNRSTDYFPIMVKD